MIITNGRYRISHKDLETSFTVKVCDDDKVIFRDNSEGGLSHLLINNWKFERLGDVEVIDATT